ncbi:MAG TPA: heparin lyase I family protein [Bryobacteraceae bacterium]|nr:heparin lyase I family protein [Bryobacteraceae bacterium]
MTTLPCRSAGSLVAAAIVCAAIPAHAKILFQAGFETGDLSEWNSTGTRSQNASPRNVQVVTDVVRSGKYAGKFTIHEDDVFNAQQQRVQVGGPKITVQEGADTFMSFFLQMADPPKDRDNFFYWEGTPPPRWNNVMTWWVEPGAQGETRIRYGTGNLGRNGVLWDAPFAIGKWYQLAMHIHWSEDEQVGNVRLWFNGVLVLDKRVKTKGAESVYFCQPGIHRSPHRASVDTIYFDDFLLSDTPDEVLSRLVKPPSGGSLPKNR